MLNSTVSSIYPRQRPNSLSILYRMPLCSRFGQERSKPSTYHRYNSSGSTHEKRTHHAGRWLVICPSVGFEKIRAHSTSSSTYRRRLYARRGANKRMGCVLADGAAYRGGGGSSSHFFAFRTSFLSLSFV